MALDPLYTIDLLPSTSQAAIREFQDRYLAALGAAKANGWADRLGALVPTSSPMVTYPVSQLRTKYKKAQGENSAKTMQDKSFDIKTQEFEDGFEAELLKLTTEVFAYRRWQEAPARLVLAEERFRHAQIAALLEAGTTTACVDGKNFFATDHPANMFASVGTFSNYQSSTKDVVSIANLETEVTAMMGVLDENGDKMGIRPDTILVPVEKAEPLKNLLKKEMIAGSGTESESNPYLNGFNVEVVPEFTDANDWYLVDSKAIKAQGIEPWVALRQTVPQSLALRVYDESSDFFRDHGRLKISSHIWYGFGLALPHAIRLVKGA